jgi:putative thioredoxin
MPTNPNVFDVSESNFQADVLARSSQLPVIVDFWAPWCGPCRALGPLLEKLAAEAGGSFLLARLNVDDSPNLAAEYGVQGIPAVKAFRDGRVVDEFTGALPESKVREFLRKVAPSAADRALAEATSLLAIRQWARAEAALRRAAAAVAGQPASAPAVLGLARALLAQGRGCEAQDLLEDFPRSDQVLAAEKLLPLARLLCAIEAPDQPLAETDLDALYYQAGRLLARGQLEAGMDGLLDLLRQDKRYRKGEPRHVLLAVFELLGDDEPTTRDYRRELASVLY